MKITDIFVHRPVLATVISLMILVLGIRSLSSLPIRQFPFTQNAVITVRTVYTGADPELVAGFITKPMETAVAQVNGIDYMTSTSTLGVSSISANLKLNVDPNKVMTEMNTKVNATLNELPKEAQNPSIEIQIGETIAAMYIGFNSDVLSANQITDYLIRVVQPQLQAIEGVQLASIIGKKQFALRAWLDPAKMAAYALTGVDVSEALIQINYISAAGRTDGDMVSINLIADTGLHSSQEFEELIVKTTPLGKVRLKDIANVTLGSDDYDTSVGYDGKKAVYIGIRIAPSGNLLEVIQRIHDVFPGIQAQLPKGLDGSIIYDSTKFVKNSIYEVVRSLTEAILIVTAVIFLFLGSLRSVAIPLVAIPLSLIGTFFIMLLLGYSVNLLTLLALVLAIGLVVDDAIIVVENVHRHINNGLSKLEAALLGARELANPIIAISIVLIAVYVPIGFMGGLTGALFTEFAFTLAGAVAISAIVALTLSPMMCSKLLKPSSQSSSFMVKTDRMFERLKRRYESSLKGSLNFIPVTLVFALIILSSNYFLYETSQKELAPQEDQGILISILNTAPNATIRQTELYSSMIYDTFASHTETEHVFQLNGLNGLNSSIGGMILKHWNDRTKTTNQLQPIIQKELAQIPGGTLVVFQPPSLPGSSGLPIQFVLATTQGYEKLNEVTQKFLEKVRASGLFIFVNTDLKIDKPQTSIVLNREKAAELGLSMADIGSVLSSNLSEGYVNYFSLAGRSYKVIPQIKRSERLNPDQVLNYYITTKTGDSIPLSTIATLKKSVIPQSINHFQQRNSATVSGVAFPGITMEEILRFMDQTAREMLPEGYTTDAAGQSRQYLQESSSILFTFFFALLIIYLSLAALFESFKDPLIVLISVPMSICGAMIFVNLGLGGASLNIYTQVGLVTLIGLISKNGILIVQFANELQKEGKTKRLAIEEASAIRLRPILMTTAATVLGVIPLLLASGAGAESRFNIGLVISTGMAIGTLFTLYVVPAMYMLLSTELKKPELSQANANLTN